MSYKLAVSNIAWPNDADEEVAKSLREFGFEGIEVALTKIWQEPLKCSDEELKGYREWWAERGVKIVAAQALLYGQPDLTLFGAEEKRSEMLAYLKNVIRICSVLGAQSLVFGSPKNRCLSGTPLVDAMDIAVIFFRDLAKYAEAYNTKIVIEANPVQYGGDFITQAPEALDLVKRVNHPGFALHLCSGCMSLGGDDVVTMVESGKSELAHVHISEPYLNEVTKAEANHKDFSKALRESNYDGWRSIEMRQPEVFTIKGFEENLKMVSSLYGC